METITRTQKSAAPVLRAFRPALGAREAGAVKEAIRSGWLGTGIYTRLFEARLARETGSRFALATNSGTAALHLALKACGVEGGEVLTTPVTSVATNHAILHSGAVPVFCDVEPETGNIDPREVERRLSRRTRAIVAVHLGSACDMDGLTAIARRGRVPLVEDVCACHAAGGAYKGRPLGSIGDVGCFSFGRFKGLTTLDGGALVHGRKDWQERLERLRRLGHAEEDGAMGGVRELGFHYRMNDLSAVVGLTQFQRREGLQKRLDSILRRYHEGLRGVSFLTMLKAGPASRGVRAYAAARVHGGRRDRLRRFLSGQGIQVNDALYPSHLYDLYKPYRRKLPIAEKFCREVLHLPYYPDLSAADVDRIVELVRRFKG